MLERSFRAKPRAFRLQRRGVEGLATAMVGRDGELARLLALLREAADTQQVRGVTIVAEAGLGKSRLVQALPDAIELEPRGVWLLLGRADPAQRLQPYGLLRDLLAWRLQIVDSDSADTARRKLVEGLAPWLADGPEGSATSQARAFGQLIGMGFEADADSQGLSPQQLRDRAFAAAAAWLRGLSQGVAGGGGGPVVLLLEDLHWADDGSLDFVEHLLGLAEPLPLALVMTARPGLLERRLGWGDRHADVALARRWKAARPPRWPRPCWRASSSRRRRCTNCSSAKPAATPTTWKSCSVC